MGNAVPNERISRNDGVSPGKTVWAMVENKNADNPKPDRTSPVVVALCEMVSLYF